MRDDERKDPDVLAHLRAENRTTERWFKPLRPLLDQLGHELRERVPAADEGLPIRRGDYE